MSKPLYQAAGKGGHCAGCYGRIHKGQYECRDISFGRRIRYHPACYRKSAFYFPTIRPASRS